MSKRVAVILLLTSFTSSPVHAQNDTISKSQKCDLPPPLVCPPPPPKGPHPNISALDEYIRTVDTAIETNDIAAYRSNPRVAEYVRDLKNYRQQLLEYRMSHVPVAAQAR